MKPILFALCLAAIPAFGQEFEVASIKPSAPNTGGPWRAGLQITPGGRVVASNFTAKMLLAQAWGVKDFQISGGPAWISTERFDITAKAAGDEPVSLEAMRPMLQNLLKERFHLALHKESKDLPVYNLVVAKGGFKLKEVKEGAIPAAPQAVAEGHSAGHGGGSAPARGGMMRMGHGVIEAQAVPISMLVTQLSNNSGRNVIDQTGIRGLYDIKVQWTPEPGEHSAGFGGFAPGGSGGHGGAPGHYSGADSNAPTLFTALQEQLGLKLEPAKGPVDLLVVDKLEKPTEN